MVMAIVAWVGAVSFVLLVLMAATDMLGAIRRALQGGGRSESVTNDVKIIQTEALHIHPDPTRPDDTMLPVIETIRRHRGG